MSCAHFVLRLPAGDEALFYDRPRMGTRPTTFFKNWLDECRSEIRRQRVPVFAGDVRVSLLIERPDGCRLQSRVRIILDAMQKAGVIENDNRIVELFARWADNVEGCQVTVYSASEESPRIPIRRSAA